jgi:hypothetical protein
MQAATLRVLPGGHGPWLVDAARVERLIDAHLSTDATTRGAVTREQ